MERCFSSEIKWSINTQTTKNCGAHFVCGVQSSSNVVIYLFVYGPQILA